MRQQPRVLVALCLSALMGGVASIRGASLQEEAQSVSKAPLSREEAKQLKNPVPYSKQSLARGRVLYNRACTECHGSDGKSLVDVIANATDLTQPKFWTNGTSEGEIFRSIRDGVGDSMPLFKDEETETDIWDLVNFTRSLWPPAMRPKLQETTTK